MLIIFYKLNAERGKEKSQAENERMTEEENKTQEETKKRKMYIWVTNE